MKILTLLTDFGTTDYYVGAVKGTVLRLAPGVPLTLVDLAHDLPAGDLETAAHLLAAAVPTFPAGSVHLAVVDPGVGTERGILVAESLAPSGRPLHRFVAPDNGLLTAVLDQATADATAVRCWTVTRRELFLDAPGQTFHGRDRFAPVAAALLRGEEPASLGEPLAEPVRLEFPRPRRQRLADGEEGGGALRLEGRVITVDRFGNLITDLPTPWLPAGSPFEAVVESPDGPRTTHRRADCYAELDAGEAAVLPGSRNTLELSLDGASLAELWGVERGARVTVRLGRWSDSLE